MRYDQGLRVIRGVLLFLIGLIIGGLLTAALAQDLRCACWTGDDDPATSYRIWWSKFPVAWYESQSAILIVEPLCSGAGTPEPAYCAPWFDVVPEPALGQVYYVIVTAFNEHGESDTEHGCANP